MIEAPHDGEENGFGTRGWPMKHGELLPEGLSIMTSVKDIDIEEEPGEASLGRGTFTFSDRYSVFDWGPMPDTIPGKGASLCTMGAFNFELLADAGIPTHYRGVLPSEATEPRAIADCEVPPTVMAVDLASVPALPEADAGYDYDVFHEAAGESFVVPLEVVFRNRVPIGSSLRRRREPGAVGLPYDEWPEEPVDLEEPIVEFSTKFERSDRYLDREEAASIAGIADLAAIEELARSVNTVITDRAEATGFRHDDGKIEVVYHAGDHLVADVAGTFDENRFAYDGQQVSKEVIRQFYRRFDPQWVAAVEAAKVRAKEQGQSDWKALCTESPDPLPEEVRDTAADLYTSGAMTYTELDCFDVDDLSSVLSRVESVIESS